jgi:hypothetical protein
LYFSANELSCSGLVLESETDDETELAPEQQRSQCQVLWSNGETSLHCCGYQGKTDVFATEPSSGGYYYPAHLACAVLENIKPDNGMKQKIVGLV